jgi:hypothetical protein
VMVEAGKEALIKQGEVRCGVMQRQ